MDPQQNNKSEKQQVPNTIQNNSTNTTQQNQQNNTTQTQTQSQNVASSQPNQQNVQQNQQDWQSFNSDQAEGDIQQQSGNLNQIIQQLQESNQQQQQQYFEQSLPNKPQQGTLGCQHYQRNCQVQAPCCKIFYTCKLCHDEKYQGIKKPGCKIQRMQFDKVKNIKCLKCQKIQPASQKCINPQCQIRFGKYACLKCMLYQNKPGKVDDIFHCDQCKMCRRGKVQNYFHCKMCGYCRPNQQKGNHKCTQNAGDSQCPVCLQVLKFSTKYYISLKCGHLIHQACLSQYHDINCPVCGMAFQKLSEQHNKQLDLFIQQTRANLPKQLLDKKVNIICNQCLHKSYDRPFHVYGIKCQKCGTYNTKMM